MTDALEGTIELSTDVDDDDGVYLILGTQMFGCRSVSVSWQMMKFAVAQRNANAPIPHPKDFENKKHLELCKSCADISKRRNDAGMSLMTTMHDTVLILLQPEERERFEEFMITAELEPEELENAIGNVIAAVGSGKGKAKGTSSHSSESSEKTQPPSRTISFGRDIGDHQHVT